jgi:FAD/FMN-containing dehydrogenase
MHSGIIPSVLEILDPNTIRVLRDHGNIPLPEVMAMILVETDGYTKTEAWYQMERVLEVFKKNKAHDFKVAASVEEAEDLWRIRKSIGSVAATLRPSNVSEDVTVPISRVPDLVTGISTIVQKHGLWSCRRWESPPEDHVRSGGSGTGEARPSSSC